MQISCSRDWALKFVHIRGNKAADCLSDYALELDLDVHHLVYPLVEILGILLEDINSVCLS